MKKLKINKMALSVATAFLMLTSIVSTVASASGGNEIKLTSDKNFAQSGDSINVKASLEPDKTGVAGFTIDLHYDPSKVTVYVPTDEESESTYNVGSKFSVITNYVAICTHSQEGGQPLMNEKLEALNQEIEKTEKKLRWAQQEEKRLTHQAKALTRKERTHRLCTRAAMLESYLPHPEAITDEQVSLFLKLLFHKDSTRQLMEKVFAGNGTEKEGAE